MTHEGKAILDAIVAGLDGVTPGPWRFHPHYKISGGGYGKIADSPTPHRYLGSTIMAVGYKGAEVDDYWLSIKDTNAAHIARCDPDSIRSIAAYVAELERQVAARIRADERERADRYRYVLEGVLGAIKTGRNEPLVIWKEQIEIALSDAAIRNMGDAHD